MTRGVHFGAHVVGSTDGRPGKILLVPQRLWRSKRIQSEGKGWGDEWGESRITLDSSVQSMFRRWDVVMMRRTDLADSQVSDHQSPGVCTAFHQKNVLGLDIAMQNIVLMHVVQAKCHLHKPVQNLRKEKRCTWGLYEVEGGGTTMTASMKHQNSPHLPSLCLYLPSSDALQGPLCTEASRYSSVSFSSLGCFWSNSGRHRNSQSHWDATAFAST